MPPGSPPIRRTERPLWKLGIRLLRLSAVVERAQQLWSRLRSLAVLSLASGPFLDYYNDYAYARHCGFGGAPRAELIWWERAAIESYFPAAPARVLVGGAGAGREVLALVDGGYEVVAFEPSPSLLQVLSEQPGIESRATIFQAAYQDLPRLRAVPGSEVFDLRELGSFDAAVLGFGSFSHLRTREERIAALRAVGSVTRGAVLISFIDCRDTRDRPSHRWIRRLPGSLARDPANIFSVEIGFYHLTSRAELEDECAQAGLRVEYAFMSRERHTSPHAVLSRI